MITVRLGEEMWERQATGVECSQKGATSERRGRRAGEGESDGGLEVTLASYFLHHSLLLPFPS